MSLETQIAALVAASNNLTGAVSGKLGEIDQALVDAGQAYAAQLNDLKARLPRLAVTQNMMMVDADSSGLPDNWGMHSEVTASHVQTIASESQGAGRPSIAVAFLDAIEADVKEIFPDFNMRTSDYYRTLFNVWQFQWSQRRVVNATYLSYPFVGDLGVSGATALPMNSYVTLGAFVRVLEGDIAGSWATGRRPGKWSWCSAVIEPLKAFGSYTHLLPDRLTDAGVVQVALAGACTGVVTHPGEWFSMFALKD